MNNKEMERPPLTGIGDHVTEAQEVAIHGTCRETARAMPFEQFDALCLRLALEYEPEVRAKFRPENSAVKLRDEYYEQVNMGLREPIDCSGPAWHV